MIASSDDTSEVGRKRNTDISSSETISRDDSSEVSTKRNTDISSQETVSGDDSSEVGRKRNTDISSSETASSDDTSEVASSSKPPGMQPYSYEEAYEQLAALTKQLAQTKYHHEKQLNLFNQQYMQQLDLYHQQCAQQLAQVQWEYSQQLAKAQQQINALKQENFIKDAIIEKRNVLDRIRTKYPNYDLQDQNNESFKQFILNQQLTIQQKNQLYQQQGRQLVEFNLEHQILLYYFTGGVFPNEFIEQQGITGSALFGKNQPIQASYIHPIFNINWNEFSQKFKKVN